MAKIAQISAKYIITASINIEGIVDRPDVIGAVFGQTEGLLGSDLELRELQRSGRIGRIEVNVNTKTGKTQGEIIVPSSLDKAETAIVGAALEVIQRIGPCNAHIRVQRIEDVRINKRQFVIDRAKELLRQMMDGVMPDSQELADEVVNSVRVMEITEWGKERLPAGPGIDESDEITLVEGRADVLTLLKNGFKNAIAINGTSIPPSIAELCRQKVVTVFVDGDRGGDLIIKELMEVTEIDFITKAPDGKEVEELTKKEIHKSLRSKVAAEQYKLEVKTKHDGNQNGKEHYAKDQARDNSQDVQSDDSKSRNKKQDSRNDNRQESRDQRNNRERQDTRSDNRENRNDSRDSRNESRQESRPDTKKKRELSAAEKKKFGEMLEDLIGTRGAYILDEKLNILGKVPISELLSTIKSLRSGMHAVIYDGSIERDLAETCERNNVNYLVGMGAKVKSTGNLQILVADDLQ